MTHQRLYETDELYGPGLEDELEYVRETGGICSGMVLHWLFSTVGKGLSAEKAIPNIVESIKLQKYVEKDIITINDFPSVIGLEFSARWDFTELDKGLNFVWQKEGSYILIYTPMNEHGGHALGLLSTSGSGYFLDPGKGCYIVYTVSSFAELFRDGGYVSSFEGTGMKLIVIEVSRYNNQDEEVDEKEVANDDTELLESTDEAENEFEEVIDEEYTKLELESESEADFLILF